MFLARSISCLEISLTDYVILVNYKHAKSVGFVIVVVVVVIVVEITEAVV